VSRDRNQLAGRRSGDSILLEGRSGELPIRWRFVDIRPASFLWRGEAQREGEGRLGSEFRLTRMPDRWPRSLRPAAVRQAWGAAAGYRLKTAVR
jgi:hypothetical protein